MNRRTFLKLSLFVSCSGILCFSNGGDFLAAPVGMSNTTDRNQSFIEIDGWIVESQHKSSLRSLKNTKSSAICSSDDNSIENSKGWRNNSLFKYIRSLLSGR
jgi:hypothetical protein